MPQAHTTDQPTAPWGRVKERAYAKTHKKRQTLKAPIASSRLILSSAETFSSLVTHNMNKDQTDPVGCPSIYLHRSNNVRKKQQTT